MNCFSVEVVRFNDYVNGVRADIDIDWRCLSKIYQNYGLPELPEDQLEEAFECLEGILEGHLRAAVDNAIEEYIAEYGNTPAEHIIESLYDVGELEKPVSFYVGGIRHTAMLGKRDEAGKVPLLLDGSPHWRNETVPYPWETTKVIFHHEVEKAISGFYRDAKKL